MENIHVEEVGCGRFECAKDAEYSTRKEIEKNAPREKERNNWTGKVSPIPWMLFMYIAMEARM